MTATRPVVALARPSAPVGAVRRARVRRRRLVLTGLVVLGVATTVLGLTVGDLPVSVPHVVGSLLGRGSTIDDFVVVHLRLPRLVLAILAGAALALSGALFQAVLHNPLASPDVVGVTGGASAAAVFAILVLGLDGAAVSLFALAGALAVAALIHVLAWRGGVAGQQFVLVGIGIGFMVTAALGYLLTRAEVQQARVALVWLVGGVGSAQWGDIAVTGVALSVLGAATAAAGPSLRVLQLGDDTARGLGVRAGRRRVLLLGLAVALAAVGTAATGPLAFVAFVSAPIARRLLRDGSPALLVSAVVGAVLVVAADLAGQHVVPALLPGAGDLPAGVVTGVIGAPYLLWLLTTSGRSRGER